LGWAVAVEQLVVWVILTPEVRSLDPFIDSLYKHVLLLYCHQKRQNNNLKVFSLKNFKTLIQQMQNK